MLLTFPFPLVVSACIFLSHLGIVFHNAWGKPSTKYSMAIACVATLECHTFGTMIFRGYYRGRERATERAKDRMGGFAYTSTNSGGEWLQCCAKLYPAVAKFRPSGWIAIAYSPSTELCIFSTEAQSKLTLFNGLLMEEDTSDPPQ